ncbi:MAG TPA: class I SAM-dependent methyltransferase [Pyrinomonadaceae bacterium]
MNQDLIWRHFQNESPEVFQQGHGRIRFLVHQVVSRLNSGSAVLNVGTGDGLFVELISQAGMDAHSVDPDEESIARLAAGTGTDGRARVGSLDSIPFLDNSFDAVIVSEVLEHLSDETLGRALAEVDRVLAANGIVAGTVPANENLSEQITVCPCCGEIFHRWGHLQSFDAKRLQVLLSQRFTVETVKEKFLPPWSYLDWKAKSVCVVKNSLLRLGISWPGASLFFAARKR